MQPQLNILPKIEQHWSIKRIVEEAPPTSWASAFNDAKEELEHISNKLDNEKVFGEYFPKKTDLFNAFRFCKLEDVKVIILKNEPYPTKDIGLAYSVGRNDEIPSVLYNIYQELKREYIDFKMPNHGDLRFWALQGVLLLHKSLTCSTKKSHSRYELWHGFLNRIFKAIVAVNPYVIVLLWGQENQKISSLLPDSFKILESADPGSYHSKFYGCNHFIQVNELLVKQNKKPIDWQV